MQDAHKPDDSAESMHLLDYWRVVVSRKEAVLIVFLLVVVAGVLTTFNMSKVYRASVVVKVEKETPDVELFSRDLGRFDPQFQRTQFELIQSRPVLEETVRRLNLVEKFSQAYGYPGTGPAAFNRTVRLLSGGINAQQYRDTNLIEIQVHLPEFGGTEERAPQVAAQVANMIAEVFRSQNMQRTRDQKLAAMAALNESLEERRARVEELEAKIDNIRQEHEITILRPAAGPDTSLNIVPLQRLEERRIVVGEKLIDNRSRYERLLGLPYEERLSAAQHVVRDPGLASLVMDHRKAEVQLQQKMLAFGDRHPDVMQIRAVTDELAKKIDEALQGLMTGLRIEVETLQEAYDDINERLEELKAQERLLQAEGYREYEKANEALAHAKAMRDRIEFRYMEEDIELNIPRTTVQVMVAAQAPSVSNFVRPNILLNVILSLIVGLAAGLGLAFFVEYLDTSVKTVDDVEKNMDLPVLGVIPQKVKPFTTRKSREGHAEAYRVLRANIQFSKQFKDSKALCVTSGSVGEGKSLTIFNLARVCAELGDKVLVVDADMHRPTQHKMFGMGNESGLANVLSGDLPLAQAVQETDLPNLHFIPSGRMRGGAHHGLMNNSMLISAIETLRKEYDYVLIDAPPVIGVSDASLLVRQVDGVLQVVQHRKYPWTLSNRARHMIGNVGGNVIGVVLNNLNFSREYSYYGYGYSSRYYNEKEPHHA